MKTLTRSQWLAVFAGIGLLGYLLFSNLIMNLFNPSSRSGVEMPETGFVAEDLLLGAGPEAASGDTVVVHYIGSFPDGKIFDSSLDRNVPFEFILGTGSVIRGWDEGIVGMRAGGRRILIIAPDYAYGRGGSGPIPPNSTLIFEVELIEIKKNSSN